jgi:hypothetical protein
MIEVCPDDVALPKREGETVVWSRKLFAGGWDGWQTRNSKRQVQKARMRSRKLPSHLYGAALSLYMMNMKRIIWETECESREEAKLHIFAWLRGEIAMQHEGVTEVGCCCVKVFGLPSRQKCSYRVDILHGSPFLLDPLKPSAKQQKGKPSHRTNTRQACW